MINEFKEFAMKGNVVELAVAVIIGAAFGKIISSLVENILMPLIGILMGGVDFSGLMATVGDAQITYGVFIQSIIDFVIVAFVIFMVVKAINKAQGPEEEEEEAGPTEIDLLTEIRDAVKR